MACFGTQLSEALGAGQGWGRTSLVWQPLGVAAVGDHLILRNHDFVLGEGGLSYRGLGAGEAPPRVGQAG